MNDKGIAFILARRGSKGLKRKNIQLLGKRPLIEWTLDYLCNSSYVEKVCISSDDDEIIQKYNLNYSNKIICIKRPKYLSGDLVTTEKVLKHAVESLSCLIKNHHFGIYMQITEPFRPKNILKLCVEKYNCGNYDSVFAATEYHKNFWIETKGNLKRFNNNKNFSLPRQIKKSLIREDTGICLVSDISLFSTGKRIGVCPGYVIYNHPGSLIDIHTKEDLDFAESVAKFLGLD